MKIDKSKLDAMTKLSDDELWAQIRLVAEKHGVKMPESRPSSAELAKVREALSEADRLSLMSAMRMVNSLKKGNK